MPIGSDILEDYIFQLSPELLNTLLKDHTTSTKEKQNNIFWATTDYEYLGAGYEFHSPITPELITGAKGHLIMPRVLKDKETQTARVRDMAEVFTPSWMCNEQNNLVDEYWFGRQNVFNTPNTTSEGKRTWTATLGKIVFPADKTWEDYVRDLRLEITCGEAPYIASRYDTTSGDAIPLHERIGILDRKLRIVSENTSTSGEWLRWAQVAFKSTYAYEWQGDNLLIAREAMLASFIEYYRDKFGRMPQLKSIKFIAYIISWNTWQMDGIRGVIPESCKDEEKEIQDFFATRKHIVPCEGCQRGDISRHNGIYCIIKEWDTLSPKTNAKGKKIRYIDLLK